ncbi:helix-turn-helix domain-containing protein [Sphingomonas sp. VDB2]|uniref:helix-turn-helix domain-containing protein n=1 Tax=Sphingomonas sp. VDB2 TaxID=3228751 RepID=UPI003A803AE2
MQAEDLKSKRLDMGLSQADFADAIGVSRVLLGQMERGQAPIEKRTAMAATHHWIMECKSDAARAERRRLFAKLHEQLAED